MSRPKHHGKTRVEETSIRSEKRQRFFFRLRSANWTLNLRKDVIRPEIIDALVCGIWNLSFGSSRNSF